MIEAFNYHEGTSRLLEAMQLEIAQRVYLNEATRTFDARKGARLRDTLQPMLEVFIQSHESL